MRCWPSSVAEERPDQLVERLLVATRDDRRGQRPHRGSPRDVHRQGDLAEVVARLERPPLAEATAVQFPGLVGVLPGFGRQEPNDWGLGLELRDHKSPHWTGSRNSERTFGHFGSTGTFLWVDPEAGLALACLTDLPFGDWATTAWPELSDAVLAELSR